MLAPGPDLIIRRIRNAEGYAFAMGVSRAELEANKNLEVLPVHSMTIWYFFQRAALSGPPQNPAVASLFGGHEADPLENVRMLRPRTTNRADFENSVRSLVERFKAERVAGGHLNPVVMVPHPEIEVGIFDSNAVLEEHRVVLVVNKLPEGMTRRPFARNDSVIDFEFLLVTRNAANGR